MKNIIINSHGNAMNLINALFQRLLEESNHNLNQYIDSRAISFSYDTSQELKDGVKEFLDAVQEIYKHKDNQQPVLNCFEQFKKNSDCDQFVDWAEGIVRERVRPYEDAEFLRQMEMERFEQLSLYVFENLILYYIGEDQIDAALASVDQIYCCSKIMYTFVNMIIGRTYRKDYAFSRMKHMFGLDSEKCERWHSLLKGNEDQLWRILIMQKISDIEDRLD